MTDNGLVVLEGQGELIIGSVSLMTPAWWTLDVSPLWDSPTKAGANVRIPQRGGRHAYRRWPDETTYQLEMHVNGAVNQSGTPYANPVMGLKTNQDYLIANVEKIEVASQSATLELPDGTIHEADVQASIVFGKLAGSYDKPAVLFVTVVSEAGRFVEMGS